MTSIDIGCGDNKVNPYFTGVDKRLTKDTDIIAEADNLAPFKDNSARYKRSLFSAMHSTCRR